VAGFNVALCYTVNSMKALISVILLSAVLCQYQVLKKLLNKLHKLPEVIQNYMNLSFEACFRRSEGRG
jgi:hypothetical protein